MSILVILAIIASPSVFVVLAILARAFEAWMNADVREAEATLYAREYLRRMEPKPVEEMQVQRHEAIEQHRSPMLSRIEAELQEQHFPEKVLARKALTRATRFTN